MCFFDLEGETDFIHTDPQKVQVEVKNEHVNRENMSNLMFWNRKPKVVFLFFSFFL